MCCIKFSKSLSWFAIVFIILLLASCTGNPEEEATAQAAVEQLVSTNTPSPAPTELPPPSNTPVPPTIPPTSPPTNTPHPPTDTPPPPTDTPTPPTGWIVEDTLGDTFDCETEAAVDDPEVDIASILTAEQENTLLISVGLNIPLVNDYSFAVLLTLVSGEYLNYYIWETHEKVLRIGEIDSQTGELEPETAGGVAVDHDQAAGQVTFTIPVTNTAVLSDTTTVTNTIVISGTGAPLQQIYVSSFHTPQVGEAKNCDTAGPYFYEVGN